MSTYPAARWSPGMPPATDRPGRRDGDAAADLTGVTDRPPAPGGRSATSVVRRTASRALPMVVAVLDGLVVNGVSTGHGTWLALAAAAALLVRRSAPEAALLTGVPGLYLGHIAFAPLIALYFVAMRRRRALAGSVGAVAVVLAWSLPHPVTDLASLPVDRETALTALDCCVVTGGALVLGRSARSRRERLKEASTRKAREKQALTERVLRAERNRLAREMHDVVAHKVSLISLQAGVLQVGRPDDPDVQESARLIHDLSAQTVTELRHLVGVLRTAGGTGPEGVPRPRVTDIADLVRMSGVPADLELPAAPFELPEALERAAYRTVQEALTNIRKHAPGARASIRVRVRTRAGARSLCVEVRSFPDAQAVPDSTPCAPGGGHGLVGLRERAHLLGGGFHAGPTADGAFVVRAYFPVGRSPAGPPPPPG
ncbi:histidine kinase [Streptomyces sp. NBC_01635]|uniref:sensor histidine kinase n=1 Tax=Streptomyces sp. NBC_01635 TaxID=2975904 RepID=UPI003869C7DE|nr:histidine kinase [Streptomyces sp. NBC_01635]